MKKRKDNISKNPAQELPEGVKETFKARPDKTEVFISADRKEWFFDKAVADQVMGEYHIIPNPFKS
jgi:hypothetical protein